MNTFSLLRHDILDKKIVYMKYLIKIYVLLKKLYLGLLTSDLTSVDDYDLEGTR